MQINIVSVGPEEVKQGPKAKYSVFELNYSSGGQARKRKIMSFAKEIYGTLKSSQAGDSFDIVTKKNGEFWDWVAATKLEQGAGDQAKGSTASSGGYSRESTEERAQRQVMIVRQSSIASAVNFLRGSGGTSSTIINMAKDFEAYVLDFSVNPEEVV